MGSDVSIDGLRKGVMPVRVIVADLTIDRNTKTPLVILQETDGRRKLPICIGLMEASAIAAAKEKLDLPRPMTHDLLSNILDNLGGTLESVVVCDLKEGTFYATLYVKENGRILEIDSRPSDAIALALRTHAPILVCESVFDEAGIVDDSIDKWASFLSELDPEAFGKYKM
jgi:bifunctional DNase/RNase